MPNWKKLITSGSSGSLAQLSVDTSVEATSFTGSLQSTNGVISGSAQLDGFVSQSGNFVANETIIATDTNSVTSSNILALDTINNYLGINQSNPEVTLHMTGEDAQTAQIRMEQFNDSSDAPDIRTRKARGTSALPAKNNAGDFIYRQNSERYNGSAYTTVGQFAVDSTGSADRFRLTLTVSEDGNTIDAAANQFMIDGNNGGAIKFNNSYYFPTSDGSANEVLTTDGSGTLTFSNPIPSGTISSSAQIASDISGSITSTSSSIASDIATLVSFSSSLETTIYDYTGSFTGDGSGLTGVASANNATITLTPGAGIGSLGNFTTNQSFNESITIGVDGVLQDLDTLGAPASDGQFIVATGAGTFAYESGATVRTSLGLGSAATLGTAAVTNGGTSLATGDQIYDFVIGLGYTTNVGDITGVTAGVGLSGGGSSGDVTLTLDMSELTDMTATMVGTDEFIVLDNGADRRKAANEIGLSIFNNDSGFTTNTGTVDTSGTPVDNDFAKFTDANTVEGRSYSEVKSDLGLATTSAVQFDQLGIGVAQTGTSGRLKVNEHVIAAGNVYSAGTEGFVFGSTTGDGEYIKRSGNDIQVFAGASAVLTVDGDNDRVGINDTTPSYTLDVNGSLHSTDFTIADAIYHEGDTDNYIQFGTDTQAFYTANTERINIGSTGTVTLNTGDVRINEYLYHNGDTDTYLRFQTNDIRMFAGGTERIKLDSSGVAFNNQNLTNVNQLSFADPGPNEGLAWSGGNFKLYESPDDLTTNTKGNLQIVSGSTRVATFGAVGETALYIEGSGSTVFEVHGSEGQLFSITDDLSGDLFSVSDISGIPLFNVNASDESYFTGQLEVQGLLTGSTAEFSDTVTTGDITTGKITADGGSGTHIFKTTADATLQLQSTDSYTGIQFNDSGATNDTIWYNGTNGTFAIGGGGSNVSGKKLHIDGGVSIGADEDSTSVPTNGLHVQGAIRSEGDITAYYSSDKRLKENIKPILNATDKVKQIGGYEFDWKKSDDPEAINTGHDIGVIAQEVEKVIPEIVVDRKNGFKAVEYQKLVALLIESNKELAARVEELEKKLK